MKKSFIVTIDTEEDNQWDKNTSASTQNAKFLSRFQDKCDEFGFKPVYLTTYNMAKDPYYISFAKEALQSGVCEIGMHLHAWCSPPEYDLHGNKEHRSYLIEYPLEVMDEKIKRITNTLEDTFGRKIISHRSGRWALNNYYIDLLEKYGYKCDCSVTPGVDWSSHKGETEIGGSDYLKANKTAYWIKNNILEVPVTIKQLHYFNAKSITTPKALARECYHLLNGKQSWVRPSNNSLYQMKRLIDDQYVSQSDYVMFMLHSSEFMPGGSPYFKGQKDVDELFDILSELFDYAKMKYKGVVLNEYYEKKVENKLYKR